jgi:hypothetical protein
MLPIYVARSSAPGFSGNVVDRVDDGGFAWVVSFRHSVAEIPEPMRSLGLDQMSRPAVSVAEVDTEECDYGVADGADTGRHCTGIGAAAVTYAADSRWTGGQGDGIEGRPKKGSNEAIPVKLGAHRVTELAWSLRSSVAFHPILSIT